MPQLFDSRADRRCPADRGRRRLRRRRRADDFVARGGGVVRAVRANRSTSAWYAELTAVSAVAADIAGVSTTHINHLTPRVLDIDDLYRRMTERGIAMIDAIQGPPRWDGPDVLLRQTSFRALAEPRRFREADGTVSEGTLRVRFGEVEARGVALTRKGRERFDAAMATADPAAVWGDYFPHTDDEMAAQGLAYYHRGDPTAPVVYEDFLPASAAGIFRSNLDADTEAAAGTDESGYTLGLDGRRHRPPHPRPLRTSTTRPPRRPPHEHHDRHRAAHPRRAAGRGATRLRRHRRPRRPRRAGRARPAGQHAVDRRGPVHRRRDHTRRGRAAISEAAQAFSSWRTTPAPVRGQLVARLGELLREHKADWRRW